MNLKPFLNKKVLGTASLVVSGGIAAIVSFKKNDNSIPPTKDKKGPTISSILANKNIKLLGGLDTDFSKWEVIKDKYDRKAPTMRLVITLDGENLPRLTNLNIEQLSKWCTEKSNDDFESEEDRVFKQVKEFCITPKNRDYLEKNKRTLIASGNSVQWGGAVRKYTEEHKTRRITIKELGNSEVTPDLLKNWCENNIDKEYEKQKVEWLSAFCTN